MAGAEGFSWVPERAEEEVGGAEERTSLFHQLSSLTGLPGSHCHSTAGIGVISLLDCGLYLLKLQSFFYSQEQIIKTIVGLLCC